MASHRRTFAAAVAVFAASVSLYPIFLGTAWFWAGLGSVLVVAAAGTVTRLRRLPVLVCLCGGVAALLLYLNLVFANAHSLYHLLPTPGSVRYLWHLAGQGFNEAAKYAPPVPELRGMVLLAGAGIGIAALLTDLIAVRLESAALAGLPLLLLFTEPFTLSVSRGPVGTTVAFIIGVAGYLALLSSEGRDRIKEWEQADPDPQQAPNTQALAAAGRRVGFASMVLALSLPLFVPGLHTTRLFGGQPGIGGSGGGVGGVGFPDPNAKLSSELHAAKNSLVLRYQSSSTSPEYFQIYVLDKLTDSGWQLFAKPQTFTAPGPVLPKPPGLTATQGTATVETGVTLAPDTGQSALNALPVPYPATTVSAQGSVRAERNTLMVVDDGVSLAGLHYGVTSLDVEPSANALDAVGSPPASIENSYLTVPQSYDRLRSLATSIATSTHATSPLQDAIALQDWLSAGSFTYTLNAPPVADAKSLANFLDTTKRGYCQQFAFAMAVLARMLGIPSRVAYGFTAGTDVGGHSWVVTLHDAHAWPELYFRDYGWLRFEPTPTGADGQGTATTPTYTSGLSSGGFTRHHPGQTTPAPSSTGATTGGGKPGSNLGDKLRQSLGNLGGSGGGGGTRHGSGQLSPWVVFGLVVAGLVVLGLAAPGGARLIARRRRWRLPRRGASGRSGALRDVALAHAAWRELRDDLVDHGAGYLPSESPRAVAARSVSALQLPTAAAAALHRIALAEERARYAARPSDGSGLHADSAAVRRAIAASTGWRARWRARLLPPSVVGPALAAVSQAADVFGRLNTNWLGGAQGDLPRRLRRLDAGGRGGEGGPDGPAARDADTAGTRRRVETAKR